MKPIAINFLILNIITLVKIINISLSSPPLH